MINQVAPVHIKQNSLVHNVVAKVVKMDGEIEHYIASGSVLNRAGVKLKAAFSGVGYNGDTRLFKDYNSRIYLIDECREEKTSVQEVGIDG